MYQLIIAWDDFSSKSENAPDIISALEAAAIYIRDQHCCDVHIYDIVKKEDVMNWSR